MNARSLGTIMLLAASARLAAQDVRENVSGREEWFWSQRSYPSTERPYAEMWKLHTSLNTLLPRYASRNFQPVLGGSWRPIGPNGIWDPGNGTFGSGGQLDAGRVSSIAPAMTPGGPMYIGTASGGVWRSNNSGLTWTPLTDNQCALTTGAIAIDPVQPSRVYVGTGEGNGSLLGCGVLRSTDGGDTWTASASGLGILGGGTIYFYSLLVDPATAGTASTVLLAGVGFSSPSGVARSTNGGATWTTIRSANVGSVTSMIAHPTIAGTYYMSARVAATTAGRGVYRSTDAGLNWSQLPPFPGVDPNNLGRVELAMTKAQPGVLWAVATDRVAGTMIGLFRFDEQTNVWTQLAASGIVTANTSRGDFGDQGSYDLVIAIDPRDSKKIFIAGVRAYRSIDGGATFTPMAMEIHCDWHTLVFDRLNPDIMWAGTDGGVFMSTDAGNTWVSRNGGLSIAQYYPGISIHPQATRILGGSQDNGTHLYTGTLYWDGFRGGDGGYSAINQRDPTIMWAESQWTSGVGPSIVRMDALGLRLRVTGIVGTDRALFIPPLIIDPVNPAKLYFGTHRLYRTVNEGVLWTPISGDLTGGTSAITTIAVSPVDTNTIYVGTADGRAEISRDGGLTFALATGLPNKTITRVVPHPTDANRALITVSGFGTGHLFETKDGFATAVHDISGNLLDAPVNVGLYLPSQSAILVGTDVGVFQSIEGQTSWTLGPAGLPNVIVQDLVYQSATGMLVAGTFGRGMFAYNVGAQSAVLRGDVNGDGKIDAADALLVQQALTAGATSATTPVFPRGDANCNGTIDAADLVIILRSAVGLSTGAACVGTVR